jgi:SAM-dependent methyltransferase
MKSSSIHQFTCDKGNFFYKVCVRILYYPFNLYNNRNPLKDIDHEISIQKFIPFNLESSMQQITPGSSPSRKWSDLLIMSLAWQKIHEDLKTIRVLDLGCGTGNEYFKLNQYSGNKISSYTGIDISENKNRMTDPPLQVKFITYDGKNLIDRIPPETNFIFSQSSIEHFQEDIKIFKQIKSFCEKTDQPVYQLHLFPSRECLNLYRFHGVRQYTPSTLSKITRLFSGNYEKKLFILGGENSNTVHLNYITKKDTRKEKPDEYEQDCLNAFNKDMHKLVPIENANFYALLIIKK